MQTNWIHIPILATEIADRLLTQPNGIYIDGTLGLGGHTKLFLSRLGPQAKIIGFDKDSEALTMAEQNVADARLETVHASYTHAPQILEEKGIEGVAGALFDLGLSSYQLDNPVRGFSLLREGPLDMRFDSQNPLTAEIIVNEWGLSELEKIITEYGEDKHAHAIALAIMAARREGRITSTFQLKQIVEKVVYGRGKIHPATQTFQALRIAVNGELDCVEQMTQILPRIIKVGGRVAVLTFHSLEDRLVKNRFTQLTEHGTWHLVNKHVIVPSYEEIRQNSRSRSAKLRLIERVK